MVMTRYCSCCDQCGRSDFCLLSYVWEVDEQTGERLFLCEQCRAEYPAEPLGLWRSLLVYGFIVAVFALLVMGFAFCTGALLW